MLNLVVQKGATKDHDRRGLSITPSRTGKPMGYVQRFGLDFGLCRFLFTVDMCFIFYLFFFDCSSFDSVYTCISHSCPYRSSIHCYHYPSFSFCHHIISISSLLISFSPLFSNFYLNSKKNSKLSLILISTHSIFTHAYSPTFIFLLNA